MTMITPSYLGETIEYSSLHACRSTLEDPTSRINAIIHGRRVISAETALRFARFFGNSPEFWLNVQMMHDLTKAKLALGKTIAAEVRRYTSSAAQS